MVSRMGGYITVLSGCGRLDKPWISLLTSGENLSAVKLLHLNPLSRDDSFETPSSWNRTSLCYKLYKFESRSVFLFKSRSAFFFEDIHSQTLNFSIMIISS